MSYINCNLPQCRRAVLDMVTGLAGVMRAIGRPVAEISKQAIEDIEAVMERQEEIIEELCERIAIMEEADMEEKTFCEEEGRH